MEHIISVLVENKFGVLARVAGLFSARGYNIESLSVAPTLDPTTSMITIVTIGDDRIIEQIMKQLHVQLVILNDEDLLGHCGPGFVVESGRAATPSSVAT